MFARVLFELPTSQHPSPTFLHDFNDFIFLLRGESQMILKLIFSHGGGVITNYEMIKIVNFIYQEG